MGVFRFGGLLLDTVSHKTGLARLPFWAAGFVALVCVAIIASAAWTEWAARQTELRNAEVELSNLARSLIQHADDTAELADTILTGIVTALETDGTAPDRLARLQAILNARKPRLGRIRALFVYDEHGRWLVTTEAVNLAQFNNSDRDYFRFHRESADRALLVGRPVRSKSGGEWIIPLSRRWNHPDGTFGGVALATVDVSYFTQFYSQFDIGASGSIALISNDGIVLARGPDDGSLGRNLSNGAYLTGNRSGEAGGALDFRSVLDGLQRLGYYQRSGRYSFSVLATKAESDVLARWRRDAQLRICLVLCLIVLLAVIGIFLVRQLLRGQRFARVLASKEASFRLLAEGSSDMVTRIGSDDCISYVSPSSIRLVGWRPEQLVGTSALAGVDPRDLSAVQEIVDRLKRGEVEEARTTHRIRHHEKGEIWIESTLRVTRKASGEIDGAVAISRDVTEQKDIEGRLEMLATEDGLTGVANRRRFDERLIEEWGRAYRERTPLGLLIIDVDHFKKYNDSYGHVAGDDCLRVVAGILANEAQRTADLAARYGGEEFVLLLPNTDAAGCNSIAQRVRRALRAAGVPHELNLPSRRVTVSIGGAVCRPGLERSAGPASLIEIADRALYAAKDAGRDRVVMSGELMTLRSAASG
jgi:diguanylate cyclase (GGDEF)-like protein/PAS domain S-box-containing protein